MTAHAERLHRELQRALQGRVLSGDECLNEHGFETLQQSRTGIAAWRRDDNEVRLTRKFLLRDGSETGPGSG